MILNYYKLGKQNKGSKSVVCARVGGANTTSFLAAYFAKKFSDSLEATIAQNLNFINWRYLLDKIRTFFDENPDCEFWLPRFARQKQKLFRSGGQKGRGLGGRNFCPPSLSAAAEFRISLCEMRHQKGGCVCPAHPCAHNRFTPFILLAKFIINCKNPQRCLHF